MTLRPIYGLSLLLMLATFCAQAAERVFDVSGEAFAAVYRIIAVDGNGHARNGSAVLIAPGKLVTACHVTRDAKSITVKHDGKRWDAHFVSGDFEHDLCFLSVQELSRAAAVQSGFPEELRLGDPVIAVGYPRGGRLSVTHGRIKGLHNHDGAQVLQVSSPFDHGQSGGALFDANGRLIGITAFKAVAGGSFHFALPLAWVQRADVAATGQGFAGEPAFWERARAKQPLYLRAASLEADRKWQALSGVAEEWTAVDSGNPASWLCLGRALSRLKRIADSTYAFEQAIALEPQLPASAVAQLP